MENKYSKEKGKENDKRKEKYSQNNDVDNGVLENLETIISEMVSHNTARDFQGIIQFFRRGFVNQVVQTWSFYAQTNNHAKTSHATSLLVKTLRILSSHPDTLEYGTNLIKMILTNYSKVLYRGLNNQRAQITNPTIRLMKEMILFNDSQHLEEFLAFFDLSLPSLSRLLVPSKSELEGKSQWNSKKNYKSMRETFLEFWILLIEKTPALARRNLLTDNSKIMGNWFKYMDKIDSIELVEKSTDLFINSILKEKSFKRTTKCKVLNELTLSKLHHFYGSSNKELVKKVNEFFVIYSSSPEFSIAYPDNSVWFSETPWSGASSGVPIIVHQREFRIHNKLLFNLLKIFKPWEDVMQSATVIKVLKHTPELVAPYCTYLTSLGSHDPKMTSYWFGMTLVLGRIINLDIPEFVQNIETNIIPSETLVIENIIPSLLTKSALTKALQDDYKVIKQLACQLIVFAFQKLEKVLDLYTKKNWSSARATISSAFLSNIPDLNIFTSALSQLYSTDKQNKILVLSITKILGHYSKNFPNFFAISLPSPNIYTDIMQMTSSSGIDLAILDSFLQFQQFNGTQMKWWNAVGEQNSLFTSLLKLASSKNSSTVMSLKISKVLAELLHGTVIFNNNLAASPTLALINSLQVVNAIDEANETQSNDINKIWKLIDECISRCVKTVYKYVDMAAQEYNNISPFIMSLMEQWKFIDNETDCELTKKWICILLRTLIIIGESDEGIMKAANTFLENIPEEYFNVYLDFSDKNIETLGSEQYLLSRSIDFSYFQYIGIAPYASIKSSTRIPVNELDTVAVLFRLKQFTKDNKIEYDINFKQTVDDLCSKVAGFYFGNGSSTLLVPENLDIFFNSIVSENSSESTRGKSTFVLQTLLHISNGVKENNDDKFENFAYSWVKENSKFIQSTKTEEIRDMVVTLFKTFSVEHITNLFASDVQFSQEIVITMLKKLFKSDSYNIEFEIILQLLQGSNFEIDAMIGNFLQENRINSVDPSKLLSILIENDRYSKLLLTFIHSSYFSINELDQHVPNIDNVSISVYIALGVSKFDSKSTVLNEFIGKTLSEAYNNYLKVDENLFMNYLRLFDIYGKEYLSDEQLNELLVYITTDYKHKFNNLVIDIVISMNNFTEESILKWFGKMALYVTRILSDFDELSEKYTAVLSSFTKLVKHVNIWNMVNNNILNSQLEVIFSRKWISNAIIVEYALLITLSGNPKTIESSKLVQFILNNENNPLSLTNSDKNTSYLVMASLFALFKMDIPSNSNITVEQKLLTFYSGSISCCDRLILNMLELIETRTSLSWTRLIYTWDFIEGDDNDGLDLMGETKLITKEKEGLILTLKKSNIEYSTNNYKIVIPTIPEFKNIHNNSAWKLLEKFYKDTERILSKEDSKSIYNPLFLLLIPIHNKELINVKSSSEDESTVHQYTLYVQKFLNAGLLQYIICSLGDRNHDIVEISTALLKQMMYSLEENQQFKDGNVFKILLKKIIYTVSSPEAKKIVPIIWYSVARICSVLSRPATPLYEKAYRWLLSGPIIRSNDIPMLYELISPAHSDINFDSYFSQLTWVLKTLEDGVRDKDDVDFLKMRSVVEWLSNITNLPYLNANMNSMISSILYKIQRIDDGGSTLITRFGGVSTIELKTLSIDRSLQEIEESGSARKDVNSKLFKRKLILEEQRLNNEELTQSFSQIIDSQKRLVEWTDDDSSNMIKRQHK